jgi:hypothetical protein
MNKVRHGLSGIFERVLTLTLASGVMITMAQVEWVPSAWSQISRGGPVGIPVPKDPPSIQNACISLMGTFLNAETDTFDLATCISKVIAEHKAECGVANWERCMGQYGAACLAQSKNQPTVRSSFGPADYQTCCGQGQANLRKDLAYDTLCNSVNAKMKKGYKV